MSCIGFIAIVFPLAPDPASNTGTEDVEYGQRDMTIVVAAGNRRLGEVRHDLLSFGPLSRALVVVVVRGLRGLRRCAWVPNRMSP